MTSEPTPPTAPPAADESAGAGPSTVSMSAFHRLLVNSLLTTVSSTFVWFALTFWVYLETRSVVATAMVGASFSIASAFLGPVFGSYVDHHRKHRAMTASTAVTAGCLGVATVLFLAIDAEHLLRMRSPGFWAFIGIILIGAVAGQMRGIALSTCVTLLVPVEHRDRANGLVGTVTGVSFAITSVFSGLVIGQLGMGWALYIGVAINVAAVSHLRTIRFAEPAPVPPEGRRKHVDIRGSLEAIRSVPGLQMLVLLAAFNNLLGGVFMALMDAYGLSLVSVETWGFLWGFISLSFIAGGLYVARRGLGPRPLAVVLWGNLANWVVCAVFPLRASIVLTTLGMLVWLSLIPVIEAAEQTVLQRSIPFERQGRVFGFAQMVENAASPLTALLIGPLAESVFMPYMSTGGGVDLIGDWFGVGEARGIALIFVLAGVIGVAVTFLARLSRAYRALSTHWESAAASA